MKRILTLVAIVTATFTSFSQSLGYNDLGVIFGQNQNYGTARYNALSGAFGALGGDVSSVSINPAGGAVARNSMATITLGSRNTSIDARYYGNLRNSQKNYFNVSQAGAILAFDSAHNSDWNRFAFTFNYSLKNDFDGFFSTQGSNGKALFNEHPNDTSNPINQYNNNQSQQFSNTTTGQSDMFSIGFSSVHQNKLHIGAALNMHNVEFRQTTRLKETNKDNNGNTLNAFNEQKSSFIGTGVSLSAGFIYKLHQNFRFGLAYESPTWYQEFVEESNLNVFDPNDARYNDWIGYTEISATNINTDINSGEELNAYAFRLKTPSRLTASSAFIFNKKGLISIDYTYKNYKNTTFSNGDFDNVNQNFSNDFRNTHALNIGTEWRFNRMSLRGGYHYEQTPYERALKDDNLKGYSLGLGYNFGNMKLDLSYRNSENNSPYHIYNSPNITGVNPIELKNSSSRITGTVTFNL